MADDLFNETHKYFIDLVNHLFQHGGDFNKSGKEAKAAAERAGIFEDEMQGSILKRWRELVEIALGDGELTKEEETNLMGISEAFQLDSIGAQEGDLQERIVKLATLRDLSEGKAPSRCSVDVPVPFKLQKSESLVWCSPDVGLRETVVKRAIKGRSAGFSIKITKGLYFRPSAFTAAPVSTQSLEFTDIGIVFLTNKHIAFNGAKKNFKIRFSSLASIEPYKDGLELQRNTATAKPFFLYPLDGWFYYNAIQKS